jgi:muramoyltetrapeptide carboxypeptidase
MGWLTERYRVTFDGDLFSRDGFLAGSDDRRLGELNRALECGDITAIIAARGGYGAARVLPRANWSALRHAPKWIVGFSDVTALHVEAARVGVASLHAHNAAGLGRADERARRVWQDALEQPLVRREYRGLSGWFPGAATGTLFGGNLTLLFTCAAARTLFVPPGAILAIEDVTESSYRIDRMLTALIDSGLLDGVAAVLVGDFTDCSAGKYHVPAEVVLRERLGRLHVPVLAGFEFGHGRWNEPLLLGAMAHVDASRGVLTTCCDAPG